MAKATLNQLDRSRSSSRGLPQGLLETTPVLFRLPSVQVHPLPTVAELPSAALQFTQIEASPSSQPAATPVSIENQPTTAVEEKQSWWEHWSSGVVLIVLLIALYVTSMLVMKGRSQKPNNTLANDVSDFGELAGIEVPQIHNESSDISQAAEQSQSTSNLPASTVEHTADTKARAEELLVSIAGQLESGPGAGNSSSTVEVVNDAENVLSGDTSTSTPQPSLATAQLLQPTQIPIALPLSPTNSSIEKAGALPAQSVSSPIGQSPSLYDGAMDHQQSKLPLTGPTATLAVGLESALAGLPPLPSPNTSSSMLSVQTNDVSSISGLPAYVQGYSQPATVGVSIPNTVSGVGQADPVTSTVSTQRAAVGGPADAASPRHTSTPDANGEVEAIIKAYLELMRSGPTAGTTQQATGVTPVNRYQPTR